MKNAIGAALMLLVVAAFACQSSEPRVVATDPGAAEAPAPQPVLPLLVPPATAPTPSAPPPADPPAPAGPSADRDPNWPCERVSSDSFGGPGGRRTYDYGGPATCTIPIELEVVGCPTRVKEFLPAGTPDAFGSYVYDVAGRLQRVDVVSGRTGERVETIVIEYDDGGRVTRVAHEIGAQRRVHSYTWRGDRVAVNLDGPTVTYRLDRRGRVMSSLRHIENGRETTRWKYDGERLSEIEIHATGVEYPARHTYRYACDG